MKYIHDFTVVSNRSIAPGFSLMELQPVGMSLPEIRPGQFVQVKVDNSPATFLRRPISVCDVDHHRNILSLLIRNAGDGTAHLIAMNAGQTLNLVFPLGNGFAFDSGVRRPLLIGGGVGIAPMVFLARSMKNMGIAPTILTGARSAGMLLLTDKLREFGTVGVTTDDGSAGEKGVVLQHSLLASQKFDKIFCCGPAPMMKAVASFAREHDIVCVVSLENMMACGVGACLCCVEKTVKGNVCVCTDGPVFNINELTW